MSYQQLAPGQTYPETPVNENNEALGQAFCFSHNKPADDGLDVGISGGTFNGATLPDDVVTCTDDDETYIVAARADGALSAAITTTNWDDTTTYGRVARVTFVDGALTAFADERFSVGGIFDHSADGALADAEDVGITDAGGYFTSTEVEGALQEVGAALAALSGDADTDWAFTSDTGSTADSDPGAGLFKWNNATQASATFLYVDEATTDAVNVDAYMATLSTDSTLRIVQDDDATTWQEWKLTAAPVDGTGYWKLAVSLLAISGSIADGKACGLRFDKSGAASGGTAGRHAIYVAAGSMRPSVTGGCAALAATASAANQPDIVTLDFDASTQEYAQFGVVMPKSWNEGTVTFKAHWSHPATTTNFGVVWDLQAVAVSDDDAIAVAFGTAQTSTDTGGTTNDLYTSPESIAITVAGTPAAEDMVFFRLSRVTGNGSDTMAVDARLHGLTLYITTDAETDA